MNKTMENPILTAVQMAWVFTAGLAWSLIQGHFIDYLLNIHILSIFTFENMQKISIYFTKGTSQGAGVVTATLIIKAAWKYSPADGWIKRFMNCFNRTKPKK